MAKIGELKKARGLFFLNKSSSLSLQTIDHLREEKQNKKETDDVEVDDDNDNDYDDELKIKRKVKFLNL